MGDLVERRAVPPWAEVEPRRAVTPAEVAEFHDVLKATLHAMVGDADHVVTSLSGGFDSRYVVAVLSEMGVRVTALSTAQGNDRADTDSATYVCEELGIPQYYVPLHPQYVQRFNTTKVRALNAETSLHDWYMGLVDGAPFSGAHHVDGLAGDVVARSSNYDAGSMAFIRINNWAGLARYFLTQCWGFDSLGEYSPSDADQAAYLDGAVAELIAQTGESSVHAGVPTRLFLQNRIRRGVAPVFYGMVSRTYRNVSPFMADLVLERCAALDIVGRKSLYGMIFEKYYPRLARIPLRSNVGMEHVLRPGRSVSGLRKVGMSGR